MSKIASKIYRWEPSPSEDVVKYLLFYTWDGSTPDLNSEHLDVGLVTTVNLQDLFPAANGQIRVAVAAVDSAGNWADFGGHATAMVDFEPPLPAGLGVIE